MAAYKIFAFTDCSKGVLFCGSSMLFLSCFCYVFVHVCLLMPCALWSPAGKRLTSWLSFVVSNCEVVTFPLQGSFSPFWDNDPYPWDWEF